MTNRREGEQAIERHSIKSVALNELEAAIARALREVTGTSHTVSIEKLELATGMNALFDRARIEMTIERHNYE